jgi:hypothetical protein
VLVVGALAVVSVGDCLSISLSIEAKSGSDREKLMGGRSGAVRRGVISAPSLISGASLGGACDIV